MDNFEFFFLTKLGLKRNSEGAHVGPSIWEHVKSLTHDGANVFEAPRRGVAPRPTPFTTPRRLWRTPRRRHTHIVRRCKLEFLYTSAAHTYLVCCQFLIPSSFLSLPKALLLHDSYRIQQSNMLLVAIC